MKIKKEFIRLAAELKLRLSAKLSFSGKITFPSQAKASPQPERPPTTGGSADRPRRESPFGKHGSN